MEVERISVGEDRDGLGSNVFGAYFDGYVLCPLTQTESGRDHWSNLRAVHVHYQRNVLFD